MGGIVFACVAPHGFFLIPELSGGGEGALATRAALEEAGRRCALARPDVIVIATPHGTRVEGAICLAAVGRAAGSLRWGERQVEMNVPVDIPLTDSIAAVGREHGVPMALAGFGGNRRDQSVIPLDWGTLIPLWFLGHGRNQVGHGDVVADRPSEDLGPPVVIMTPSRSLPRHMLPQMGAAIAEAAARDGRRVAFVASCDWAHTHAVDGPYGFHPAAAEVDALVVQAFAANAPGRLIDLPDTLAQDVALDGLWQSLILAGALQHTSMQGELLSYEAPTYFGMIVAAFAP